MTLMTTMGVGFNSGPVTYSMSLDNQGTATVADDQYALSGPFGGQSFGSLQQGTDKFGQAMTFADSSSASVRVELYGAPNARGGALDYVRIGHMTNGVISEVTGPSFFVMGRPLETPYLSASGSASFTGVTRGAYRDTAGVTYATASDLTVAVDLGARVINGATSNFKAVTAAGATYTPSIDLNFSFTAAPARETFRPRYAKFMGSGSNATVKGLVEGFFYGEHDGPVEEVALSYTLDAAGSTLVSRTAAGVGPMLSGVGAAKVDVPSSVAPPMPPGPTYRTCTTSYELGCGGNVQLLGVSVWRTVSLTSPLQLHASPYTVDSLGQGTLAQADDVVIFQSGLISGFTQEFRNFRPYVDPFGASARYAETTGTALSRLDIFEVQNVLKGGLDYIQVGRMTGNYSTGIGGTNYHAVAMSMSPPLMPNTGTATFTGGARGDFVDAGGQIYRTANDVTLTADFAAKSVNGAATNFRAVTAAGAPFTLPADLSFTFTGAITGVQFTGPATGATMQGAVDGIFAGVPSDAPREAAISYRLTSGGVADRAPLIYGAGGLRKD